MTPRRPHEIREAESNCLISELEGEVPRVGDHIQLPSHLHPGHDLFQVTGVLWMRDFIRLSRNEDPSLSDPIASSRRLFAVVYVRRRTGMDV